jgi:nitrogen-specific signal transduction histidine kinase/CheY-like chemotaxis protein
VPLGMQAIGRDVTERIGLETQLRQSQKMEALGRLAGGVAHDFNNLLTVMGGYGEYLHEELRPEDPLREATREIARAVERAGGLTRQMLAFSRQQVLRPVILQLNQSLESVTSLLRRIIGEDVQLAVETDPNLYPIRADRNQIEQVLLNLAVNARDAMPNGGKLVLRYANVSLAEPRRLYDEWMPAGEYVAMSVQDTGIGMSEELQARIFEPFFTTKGDRGTGLGLATVHGIVRQSQGYIQVESKLGEGTTFTVYFQRVDESAAGSEMSGARNRGRDSGTETVLVVEDQEEVRLLMQHMLRTRGYTVVSASCGDEAVQICREHGRPIQLLVTDVLMPGLPVPKMVEDAIELHPGMRVLYVSGYAQVDGVPNFAEICAGENFLPKPFHPDEFLHKVRIILDAPAEAGA